MKMFLANFFILRCGLTIIINCDFVLTVFVGFFSISITYSSKTPGKFVLKLN